jgi:YfiR/HmsC-like
MSAPMNVLGHCRVALILLAMAYAPCWAGAEQTTMPGEYDVKAVFLFNFSQFVDWPAPAFEDARAPLVIGVLGNDPFGSALEVIVRGQTANGRPIVVQRYTRVEEIGACHILFIGDSEQSRLPQVLAALAGRHILTVGDFDDFAGSGGVIRFVNVGNRIRLHINLQAAKAANLSISSKLLRPSYIVEPGED